MDGQREQELQHLLGRLSRAIHTSVTDSEEVRDCLDALRRGGWQAVMLLEASPECRDGEAPPAADTLRIDIDATRREAEYRLGADDARWLASLGISPTRHRSRPQRPLPPLHQPLPRASDDI